MALETGSYISSLVATNPVSGDPKSQGDDHLRLLKATILATFPNITGAVTPVHGDFNALLNASVSGTGASIYVVTQTVGNNSKLAASTAYVDATAMNAALPSQSATTVGKFAKSNGSAASWGNPIGLNATAKTAGYTAVAGDDYPQDTNTTGAFTVTLPAAPSVTDAPILIHDLVGTFATANLTLGRNSLKIMGLAENLVCNINNFSAYLVYTGATYGWRFVA